jgi:hypothetical protein
MPVPAAMEPTVMTVDFDARAAIVVTVAIIIVTVAADPNAKSLSARHCGRCNRDGR